ncbi:MAG: NfeD family protein [Kiloniellales bacterium]
MNFIFLASFVYHFPVIARGPGMSSKGQLIVLELLSGLFGWVWIGGGIAALVFAGLALFSDWSWWNVLYAAIVSGVAKWLARGFLDNQKRVAFEADMVSKGMSPKEARQAWLEAYAGQDTSSAASDRPSSDALKIEEYRQNGEERAKIIADYGAFMEQNPSEGGGQIWDVKCLPYDKEAILKAICLEIVREDDEKRIEALKVGALFLADYQDGVGDRPISMLGVDLLSIDLASLKDKDNAEALAAKIAKNPDRERFETYKPIIEEDRTRIQAMLLAADQVRRDMPEEKKREILG